MIKSLIIGLVMYCTRRPWSVVALFLGLALGSSFYAVRHFAITTDVNDLISPDLPWAQRGARYLKDFPQRGITVVVEAPTPELADQAAARLAEALRQHSDRFRAVSEPGAGSFFERNGLLFLPKDDAARITSGLSRAQIFSVHLRQIPA